MNNLAKGLLLAFFIIVAFTALNSIIQAMVDSIVGDYGSISAYAVLVVIFIVAVGAAAIIGGVSIRKVLRKFR